MRAPDLRADHPQRQTSGLSAAGPAAAAPPSDEPPIRTPANQRDGSAASLTDHRRADSCLLTRRSGTGHEPAAIGTGTDGFPPGDRSPQITASRTSRPASTRSLSAARTGSASTPRSMTPRGYTPHLSPLQCTPPVADATRRVNLVLSQPDRVAHNLRTEPALARMEHAAGPYQARASIPLFFSAIERHETFNVVPG
jgi:hypothetical protein